MTRRVLLAVLSLTFIAASVRGEEASNNAAKKDSTEKGVLSELFRCLCSSWVYSFPVSDNVLL